MKQFKDYDNPNESKVTALVLIDILNCLERIEKELHAARAEPKPTVPRDVASNPQSSGHKSNFSPNKKY